MTGQDRELEGAGTNGSLLLKCPRLAADASTDTHITVLCTDPPGWVRLKSVRVLLIGRGCGACMCCDSRGISIKKKKHCCARVRCGRQASGPGVICCGNAKAP